MPHKRHGDVFVCVYIDLSHCGGHVESQDNKQLCFYMASLALNSLQCQANRAKTKLFILKRLNMTAE